MTAEFPLTLIGIAVVFPFVFSISGAYKRRAAAVDEFWLDEGARASDLLRVARFLMIKEGASEETSTTELIVVLNWIEELKRLVPTN